MSELVYRIFFHEPDALVPECRHGFAVWTLTVMNRLRVVIRGRSIRFEQVDRRQDAFASIRFKTNKQMTAMGFKNLSAAEVVGQRPRCVMINKNCFYKPPPHWPSDRRYREYVVAHELLHSMNATHVEAVRGEACPLMFPQSLPEVVKKAGCIPSERLSAVDVEELERQADELFAVE